MTQQSENPVRRINNLITVVHGGTAMEEMSEIRRTMRSFVKGEDVVFFSQGCPEVLNGKSKFLGGDTESGVVLSVSNYLFQALQQEKDERLRLLEFLRTTRDINPMSNICTALSGQDFQTASCYVSFVQVYKERIYDLLDPLDGRRCALPLKKDVGGNVIIKGVKEILIENCEAVKTTLEFGKMNAKEACLNHEYRSSDCHYLFIMRLKQVNSRTIPMCIFCDLAHHNQNRRTLDALFSDASLRAVQKHIDILCSNALPQFFQDQKSLPICSRSILMRLSLKIFQGNGKILYFPCPHAVKRTIQFKDLDCPKPHIKNPKRRGRKTMKTENIELRAIIDQQEEQLKEKDGTIENLRMRNTDLKGALEVMEHKQEVALKVLDEKDSTILKNIDKLGEKDLEYEKTSSTMKRQLKEKVQFAESQNTLIQHLQESHTLLRQSVADKEALLEKERLENNQLKEQCFNSVTSHEVAIKEKEEIFRRTTARLLSKEKSLANLQRRIIELDGRNIEKATKVSRPCEDNVVMLKKIKTEDLKEDQNFAHCSWSSQPAENLSRFYGN